MPLIRTERDKISGRSEPESGLDGLIDPSPEVRWAAVSAIASQPGSVPTLAGALARETHMRVREAIFTGLAQAATPESVLAVLPYVRSDTASLRTGALDALRAMPALTEPHLTELLSDPDSDVRVLACDLARVMTGPEAPKLLCALIEVERQANVCAAAVEALSEIGDAGALPSLAICAERFVDDPFLVFASKAASERLSGPPNRG